MSPAQYERVTEIFDAARSLGAEARRKLLRNHDHEDEEVLTEVERMLAYHDRQPDFLASPIVTPDFRRQAEDGILRDDDRLLAAAGPWRLIRVIGEGGFARVYLGEQNHPVRRQAAVKVLRDASMSRRTAQRLQAECQALAHLDHPGIVGMLEAGQLADGSARPYFVMEYVSGIDITSFCHERNLDIRGRLALFLEVCDAVQHAHLRGILHRDLKPSNVLVTERDGAPTVRIIDFGVAKALGDLRLTQDTLATSTGELVGTLNYMAPEQLDGRADIRSDVYALGALLYQLLTKIPPIDIRNCTVVTAAQRIRESSASPPSRLVPGVPCELDVIVAMALAKSPEQRYQSVGDLAADLRRCLAGEPILAKRPTLSYLLRKYVSRHRAVSGMALVTLTLVGAGVALLAAENFRARTAEDRWAQRVHMSVRDECVELAKRVGTLDQRTRKADTAYSDALELLARRPREAMYLDLAAEATRQQSNIAHENGDSSRALELRLEALRLRQQAVKSEPQQEEFQYSLSIDMVLIGDAHYALGHVGEMRNWFARSAELTERLASTFPTEENRDRLAWSFQRLASAELTAGHIPVALKWAEKSLTLSEEILTRDPKCASALACARQTHTYMAALYDWQTDRNSSAEHRLLARELAERLCGVEPNDREASIALLHAWMADADGLEDRAEALQTYTRGYELAVALAGADPHHGALARFAACYALRMALAARGAGDSAEAARLTKEALKYADQMPSANTHDIWGLASIYFEARVLLRTTIAGEEQRECEERARALCARIAGRDDAPPEYLRCCAEILLAIDRPADGVLALQLADRALSKNQSPSAAAFQTRGEVRLAAGLRLESLADFQQALKFAPDQQSRAHLENRIRLIQADTEPPLAP